MNTEVMDISVSPPTPAAAPPPAPAPAPAPAPTPPRSTRIPHHAPDQNTITNICTSNIILDLPQVTTRSRTGAHKAPNPAPLNPAPAPNPPTVTKIIISKQMLAGTGQQIPTSVVTVIPAPGPARQPPPLQQMQNTPLPPRLQQMVHSPAPPPLQAKPRGGGGAGASVAVSAASTPPPPLQIKIVPAPVKAEMATPFIVTTAAAVSAGSSSSSVPVQACATPAVPVQVVQSAATAVATGSSPSAASEEMAEEFTSGEVGVGGESCLWSTHTED